MGDLASLDDVLASVMDRGIALAATDEELAAWEAEETLRQRHERLVASGIAERLTESGIAALVHDRSEDTRALQLVRPWVAKNSRPMLVLLGDMGVGKTHAAAWALSRKPGRYIRARDLVELGHGGRSDRAHFWEALRTELLVIDELGLERDETEARDTLQDVVDARQRLPRRTLLLGNLTAKELADRYDARTLDRMGAKSDDAGIAIFRRLRGKSRRRAR